MKRTIRITVAEPSAVLRGGMIALLRGIDVFHAEVFEVSDTERLPEVLKWQQPDILMINPFVPGAFSLSRIRKESGNPGLLCFALQFVLYEGNLLRDYDEVISLYDTPEQIREKLLKAVRRPVPEKQAEPLSQREKEVVAEVIRGLTNKQIADRLCLSTHTVITHRRNIASKLGIHSTAGLTIYAIVNKLVELDDLKEEGESDG